MDACDDKQPSQSGATMEHIDNGGEFDEKRKELEVAEFMCGIQQINHTKHGDSQDIQQKAIDSHHQRQAEQITGATPYHIQRSEEQKILIHSDPPLKDNSIKISTSLPFVQFTPNVANPSVSIAAGRNTPSSHTIRIVNESDLVHDQRMGHDQTSTIELVELVENNKNEGVQNTNYQVFQPNNQIQIQASDTQFHPSDGQEYVYEDTQLFHGGQLIAKTEQFENGNQIIITNDQDYTEEIYTDQAQEQITYLDETGNEIGESHRPQGLKLHSNGLQQFKNVQPVYIQNGQRRKSIIQMRQPPKIQVMDTSREAQFIQIQSPNNSETQQQIQLGTNGNSTKNQPVVYYQTILLPSQSNQTNSPIQVQNANIIQMASKESNRSSNVIFLSSNGTIETQQPTYKIVNTNQKIEYVKVDQNGQSLLDLAATQAGIDLKSETEDNIQSRQLKPVKTEQVQSHHAYPSPFSQIPIADRTHQCKYCPKRFARADECKRHERIHTDTRPFSCTYCPRAFTRKDHLRTHTRCHTKEKPYICPLCSRGFARSDERIRHIKTHVKKGECTMAEAKKKLGNVQVGRRPTRNVSSINSCMSSPVSKINSPLSIHDEQHRIPITIQPSETDNTSLGSYFKTNSSLTETITLNPTSSMVHLSPKITIIEESGGE